MKDAILSKLYPLHKIYGPYLRSDGRKHIILYLDGKRQTMSYPKFLLQEKLGRILLDDETTDHKDENFTNDNEDNLQVLTREGNARKQVHSNYATYTEITCQFCGLKSMKLTRDLRNNRARNIHGPYCDRSCSRQHQAINYKSRDAGTGIQDGLKNHCSNEHEGSIPSPGTN